MENKTKNAVAISPGTYVAWLEDRGGCKSGPRAPIECVGPIDAVNASGPDGVVRS